MNAVNRLLLKTVLAPKAFYTKMGADTTQLNAILYTKLLMDDRRPNSFQQVRQKQSKKAISNATLSTMIMSLIIGLLFAFFTSALQDYVTKLTVFFSFYITFLASILIADFTSVLIDVRDTYIILPKPVNDKTFVLARLLHIIIHICKTAFPLALPACIYFFISIGSATLLPFWAGVMLATLFTIFLINACYILILKITTPQRFQTIISYIQIAFSIFFYTCYQVMPRIAKTFEGRTFLHYKLSPLIPSFWFAAAAASPLPGAYSFTLWASAVLGIMVPVISIWVVIKYFAPSFNQKLALISSGVSEKTVTQKKVNRKGWQNEYSKLLAKFFTKRGEETAGFLFTWTMMIRNRDFKMKVYPFIGYMAVIITITIINQHASLQDFVTQTSKGKVAIVMLIYFSNLALMGALGQFIVSDKYKASWIFYTTPVNPPGKIISGAVKAAILQFFVPIAAAITLFVLVTTGLKAIPNLFLGFANQLLVSGLIAYYTAARLPFSSPTVIKGRSTIKSSVLIISSLLLGGLHYLIYPITGVVIILGIMSAIAAWLVFSSIKNFSWQKVNAQYQD